MSAPSEPEKYSIDEMMERLKNRPAEEALQDGELVTRADGSQAIRVRKRKRRSHQPHKEELKHNRRSRMLQVSGALILLLLALFAGGAAIVFANSAPFREALLKKIAGCSGAKVELRGFRMNPTTANADGLVLTWPEGNALRNLTARGLKAEIFPISFLGKAMTGEELSAPEGTLNLSFPQQGQAVRETPAPADPLPIRFNHYAIPKFHVLLGDPTAPLVSMWNSEGSFHPENASGRAQLLLARGNISIVGWPKLRMDRSHIEFRGGEVDVVGMRLRHDEDTRGVFELSGSISPYAADRASTLSVQLDSFPIAGIAGPEVGRLFSGRIDTLSSTKSNFLSFKPGPVPAPSLVVAFRSSITSRIELNGFPYLFALSRLLDEWYEQPVFDSGAGGTIRREDGRIFLSDLNFQNKERMALRGGLTVEPDLRISGNLEVGIAVAVMKASNNRRLDSMFGPAKDGFRWITLKVSGTAANPNDNFKELFEAAATREAPVPDDKIPSFEDLTSPK